MLKITWVALIKSVPFEDFLKAQTQWLWGESSTFASTSNITAGDWRHLYLQFIWNAITSSTGSSTNEGGSGATSECDIKCCLFKFHFEKLWKISKSMWMHKYHWKWGKNSHPPSKLLPNTAFIFLKIYDFTIHIGSSFSTPSIVDECHYSSMLPHIL